MPPYARAAPGGSNQRQEQALDQQLPDDAPPAGAERRSDRHFTLAGRGSRQEHVGHVAAGNQHEQRDSRQGRVPHAAEVADDLVDDVHHANVKILGILLGMRACARRARDDIDLRLGLLQREARLQPRLKLRGAVRHPDAFLRSPRECTGRPHAT